MQLRLREVSLELHDTFTIARGSTTHADCVLLELEHKGIVGLGEVSPVMRYRESPGSVRRQFATPPDGDESPLRLDGYLAKLSPAARCLLDVAIYDWLGKRLQVALWHYFDLDPRVQLRTSFTIGIDTIQRMLEKLTPMRDCPIIKVKLGTDDDLEIIEAIRSVYTGILRIDANEAWTPQQAVARLQELQRFNIELCEQPIPAGNPAQLRWIRERVRIPLIADEDCHDAADVLALRDCVDGVNLKLVKSGGITGGLAVIRAARALNMRVMLGCMVESSLLTTAAAQLSPLADYVDLDGPMLLKDNPYIGLTYDKGRIILPTGPGLGVTPRPAAA